MELELCNSNPNKFAYTGEKRFLSYLWLINEELILAISHVLID